MLRGFDRTLSYFLDELRSKPGVPGGYFYHLTDDIVEPLNHSHIYGAALARCAKFEEGNQFEESVKKLADFFKPRSWKAITEPILGPTNRSQATCRSLMNQKHFGRHR